MKSKLAFLALVLVCFGRCASADQITMGTLNFDCLNCSNPTLGVISTPPTNGSFVYDNTTNQFLNVMYTWDGVLFDLDSFPLDPNLPTTAQAIYQDLIGAGAGPLHFTFFCTTVNPQNGPCERNFAFFFDGPGATGPFNVTMYVGGPSLNFTSNNDDAEGIVTTPEPSALLLLALGVVGIVLVLLSLHRN
jgi:hypothetical protein